MRKSEIHSDNFGIPTDSSIKPIVPPRQKATRAWYARERDDIPVETEAPKREPGRHEAAVKRTHQEQEASELQVEPLTPRAKTQKAHSTTPQMPETTRGKRRSLEEPTEHTPGSLLAMLDDAEDETGTEEGGVIPADSFGDGSRLSEDGRVEEKTASVEAPKSKEKSKKKDKATS